MCTEWILRCFLKEEGVYILAKFELEIMCLCICVHVCVLESIFIQADEFLSVCKQIQMK